MGTLGFRIFFVVFWGLPFYVGAPSRLIRSFFLTPSALPDLPVVLVRWPLTLSPYAWRYPRHDLAFFISSMSVLVVRVRSAPVRWRSFPVWMSLFRFSIHGGRPCFGGLVIMSSSVWTSMSVRYPTRVSGFMLAFLVMALASGMPIPFMLASA